VRRCVSRCLDGAFGGLAQQGLELGKDLLDRIEVWAVGRQEEQLGAGSANSLTHGLALMAAEIVDDDDVARFEDWNEHLFDVRQEASPVDQDPSMTHGASIRVVAQGRQKGQRSPVALRNLAKSLCPRGAQPHRRVMLVLPRSRR